MESIIAVLLALAGGLGFLLLRKSKQNASLKAEKDLTERTESSKVVEAQVAQLQKEIDDLESQTESEPDAPDKFWDKHRKGE